MSALPLLIDGDPALPIGIRAGRTVTRQQWLAGVRRLSQRLPANTRVINLCRDRVAFLTCFAAAVQRGGASVMPSDTSPETLRSLRREQGALLVSDSERFDDRAIDPDVILDDALPQADDGACDVPLIAGEQVVAVPFTSGSTGAPQPHPKRWRAACHTACATAQRFCAGFGGSYYVISTVPPHHMYGLETSVMLALQSRAVIMAERPFFPRDIARAIAELPAPKVLVTTPLHLDACIRARVDLAGVAFVVSATAPLAPELAQAVEMCSRAPALEIYGCTEAGSLASRRTLDGPRWQMLPAFEIFDDGDRVWVSGPELDTPVTVPDRVRVLDATHFELEGRPDDLVNIAGKRASLESLTRKLRSLPGVRDGVIFAARHDGRTRLRGLVVTDGRDEKAVLALLAGHLDPVFLPRPLKRVDVIPRTATGKVQRAALDALVRE